MWVVSNILIFFHKIISIIIERAERPYIFLILEKCVYKLYFVTFSKAVWHAVDTVKTLTLWVWWSCLQDNKGNRMETLWRPVWSPGFPQCSGPCAPQCCQTVTGPGSPNVQNTHTLYLAMFHNTDLFNVNTPPFDNKHCERFSHISDVLPLGQRTTWHLQRWEPGVWHRSSQRRRRPPFGWGEGGGEGEGETHIWLFKNQQR